MTQGKPILLATVLSALLLGGCESASSPEEVSAPSSESQSVDAETAQEAGAFLPELLMPEVLLDDEEIYRRMIADLLYEGMRALRTDRLMTPPDESAHYYFSRVLAYERDNQLAHEGLYDIVTRYLQLADVASRQGQFANADLFLQRAEQVNAGQLPASLAEQGSQGIERSRRTLERERERTHQVLIVNARELANRSPGLSAELQTLAAEVRSVDAFVLITAPNDEQGRWIYAQIQDALEGYRVRGDIELGEQPTVRLVLP